MTQTNAPFPGAQENPMLLIGLQAKELTDPNHIPLPAKEAVNFTAAQPVTLTEGDRLYRVYGGGAGPMGGYWSPNPPPPGSTVAEWRSANAVLPRWNDGTKLDMLRIKQNKTLQFWTGGVESQVVTDARNDPIPGWFLVGGGTQFYTPSRAPEFADAVEVVDVGPTPWTTTTATETCPPDVPLAAAATDLDPAQATQAHVAAVLTLTAALRGTATRLSSAQEAEATTLGIAANNLAEAANGMLDKLGTDDAKVVESAKAHIGLARLVDISATWPHAAQTDQALTQVVLSAARLAGRAG